MTNILRCAFALSLLVSVCPAAEITRAPYLQLAREDGITIVWRTNTTLENPKVMIQQEGTLAPLTCDGAAILKRVHLSGALPETVQYEATLDGLKPETTYRYMLFDGDDALTQDDEEHHFTTHPPIGKTTPARIWVVGDSGTGQAHQILVHRAMIGYTAETKRPLNFYLHVGDMAYGEGTDDQFQNKFFKPYKETLANTVCWASMGNHEGKSSDGRRGVGPFYDAYVCPTEGEAGGVPSGNESFYSFDYGDIHMICLNSYDVDRTPNGTMAKWLVRDLAAAKSKAKWIIGFWHHPPYTKGTHDSDIEIELVEMREHIMPIMENGGVDLVICGHSHIYERSILIDGAYSTPTSAQGVVLDDGDGKPEGNGAYMKSEETTPHNGTVAVVTGHGGALGRNAKGISPIMRSIVLDHGSTILDIDGDMLSGVMLDLKGKERDQFSIVKRGTVINSIVANPWTPDETTLERTGVGVLGAPGTLADAAKARKAGKKNVAALVPKKSTPIIPLHAQWDYLAEADGPETEMWTQLGFDSQEEGWKSGTAGFGYGDGDDRTVIKEMQGKFTTIYIRREFDIPVGTNLKRLGLLINYDDAFVLHINGKELLSKGVVRGKDGVAKVLAKHEASGAEYYPLREFSDFFREGKNVIALEGHNDGKDSTDLSLDPALLLDTGK
ncbi:MAG: metallophosphoesterase family protein [Luteolibacter sp.]